MTSDNATTEPREPDTTETVGEAVERVGISPVLAKALDDRDAFQAQAERFAAKYADALEQIERAERVSEARRTALLAAGLPSHLIPS